MTKAMCMTVYFGIVLAFGAGAYAQRGFRAPLMTETNKTYTDNGKTYRLGLYEGTNTMPPSHRADGMEIAEAIVPLNSQGKPDPNGTIKVGAIGHSVPARVFRSFAETILDTYQNEGKVSPNISFVNCCLGGTLAPEWPAAINGEKRSCVCTPDLQVLIMQFTWVGAHGSSRDKSIEEMLQKGLADLIEIASTAHACAPNLKMILLNTDPYMGCASTHEPTHAYEEAFILRNTIMEQIGGNPSLSFNESNFRIPYLTWGAYLWNPDDDCSLYSDNVHLTPAGGNLNATRTIEAMLSNPVTAAWFSTTGTAVAQPHAGSPGVDNQVTVRWKGGALSISGLSDSGPYRLDLFGLAGRLIVSIAVPPAQGNRSISLPAVPSGHRIAVARITMGNGVSLLSRVHVAGETGVSLGSDCVPGFPH